MMPYENASSGQAARAEITKILQRFGCESVGFMDEFHDQAVLLAFRHRGQGWTYCENCGCRYRHGNFTREYELPDGRRTPRAGVCDQRRLKAKEARDV